MAVPGQGRILGKHGDWPVIYCFDLDGTLCTPCPEDYSQAVPFRERVNKVNDLFDEGHHIKIYTARGSLTGLDHQSLTVQQLNHWGVQYHELIVGKPFADLYIDDKAISDMNFFGSAK